MSEDTLRGVGSGREAPGSCSPSTRRGAAEERTGDESVEVKDYDAAVPATYLVRNTAEGREGQGHLCVLHVWDLYHGRLQVSDQGRRDEVCSHAGSCRLRKNLGL